MRGPGLRDGDEWMLVRRKRFSQNGKQNDLNRNRGRNTTNIPNSEN